MPSSLLELIFKTSKQGQGGKQAAAELREVKGTVADLSSNFLGMNVASLTAAGAITAVGAFVGDSVKKWSDYAEAVGKAADQSGIGAEDMSRLIQAADDMRVNQEDLTRAMGLAQKNGFLPTIDNLATLADRVKAMDPLERAATLTKIFGKSWQDVYPLLKDGGQAIRDATSAVADNLVVTKEAVNLNRDWIKATDDLGDAWNGVQYQLAQGVIPSLTEFIKLLTGPSATQASNFLNEVFAGTFLGTSEAPSKIRETGKALLEFNSSMDVGAGYATTFATNVGGIEPAIAPLTPTLDGITASFKNLTMEMLFNKAAAGLDGAAALELARGMGLVNEETYGVLGILEQLRQKYDSNKDGAIDAAEAAAGYTREVLALGGAIGSLQDRTVQIRVETEYIEKGGSPKGPVVSPHLGGKPGEATGFAEGGGFVVPPGFPNDTWPLGGGYYASSGEPVVVLPKGPAPSFGTSVTIQQVVLANRMDLEEFKVMLKQALRR